MVAVIAGCVILIGAGVFRPEQEGVLRKAPYPLFYKAGYMSWNRVSK